MCLLFGLLPRIKPIVLKKQNCAVIHTQIVLNSRRKQQAMIGFMMGSASWPLKVNTTTMRPMSVVEDESSTAVIPILNGGRPHP